LFFGECRCDGYDCRRIISNPNRFKGDEKAMYLGCAYMLHKLGFQCDISEKVLVFTKALMEIPLKSEEECETYWTTHVVFPADLMCSFMFIAEHDKK
jgi:hypothetical protein